MKVSIKDGFYRVLGGDFYRGKICSKCNETKPLSEYYTQTRKDGTLYYRPDCKKCTSKNNHAWAIENKTQMRKIRIKHSRKEHVKIRDKENKKKYRDRGGQTEWQRNNPDKVKQYRENHRDHDMSDAEWESCKKYFDDSCAYCGLHISEHFNKYKGKMRWTDLHKEHVDDDGANDISNCVPSCQSCNSQKWNFEFEEWYSENNENYNKDRHERIIKWLTEDYKKFQESK